jgi:hypothetical protein
MPVIPGDLDSVISDLFDVFNLVLKIWFDKKQRAVITAHSLVTSAAYCTRAIFAQAKERINGQVAVRPLNFELFITVSHFNTDRFYMLWHRDLFCLIWK